jgi:hypothetical protein
MVIMVLFESSIGYGLFELKEFDEVNTSVKSIQAQIAEFADFSRIAHLKVNLCVMQLIGFLPLRIIKHRPGTHQQQYYRQGA